MYFHLSCFKVRVKYPTFPSKFDQNAIKSGQKLYVQNFTVRSVFARNVHVSLFDKNMLSSK